MSYTSSTIVGGSWATPSGTAFFRLDGEDYVKVPMARLRAEYFSWEAARAMRIFDEEEERIRKAEEQERETAKDVRVEQTVEDAEALAAEVETRACTGRTIDVDAFFRSAVGDEWADELAGVSEAADVSIPVLDTEEAYVAWLVAGDLSLDSCAGVQGEDAYTTIAVVDSVAAPADAEPPIARAVGADGGVPPRAALHGLERARERKRGGRVALGSGGSSITTTTAAAASTGTSTSNDKAPGGPKPPTASASALSDSAAHRMASWLSACAAAREGESEGASAAERTRGRKARRLDAENTGGPRGFRGCDVRDWLASVASPWDGGAAGTRAVEGEFAALVGTGKGKGKGRGGASSQQRRKCISAKNGDLVGKTRKAFASVGNKAS
ncbi:uncharacterized protein BXZ73DRAFT_97039 [Epithele typhae]|uniref:uncharacterized protein n=1 Tax=Epithele typhae TaxID=378194 RepID=UPI0020084DD5|nr:uncharacterized protein BXZ73DRAFT_97039 [Epithele typhae]KAH9944560.1 hypothetical protein BXZ73DRAFT_97039 [Epithele typhae]